MKTIRTTKEVGKGNLSTVMDEIRDQLFAGACSVIVTIDPDWTGATVMLTHPASQPEPDELRALAVAVVCLRNEIKARTS